MNGVKPSSWVPLSVSLPLSLIQLITQEKWLIYGQRKEEVSAPGTTAIDNASHGWFITWSFSTTTT